MGNQVNCQNGCSNVSNQDSSSQAIFNIDRQSSSYLMYNNSYQATQQNLNHQINLENNNQIKQNHPVKNIQNNYSYTDDIQQHQQCNAQQLNYFDSDASQQSSSLKSITTQELKQKYQQHILLSDHSDNKLQTYNKLNKNMLNIGFNHQKLNKDQKDNDHQSSNSTVEQPIISTVDNNNFKYHNPIAQLNQELRLKLNNLKNDHQKHIQQNQSLMGQEYNDDESTVTELNEDRDSQEIQKFQMSMASSQNSLNLKVTSKRNREEKIIEQQQPYYNKYKNKIKSNFKSNHHVNFDMSKSQIMEYSYIDKEEPNQQQKFNKQQNKDLKGKYEIINRQRQRSQSNHKSNYSQDINKSNNYINIYQQSPLNKQRKNSNSSSSKQYEQKQQKQHYRELSHHKQQTDVDSPSNRSESRKRQLMKLKQQLKDRKLQLRESKICENDEKVIFECELLKLCPGVQSNDKKSQHYVERYCQITENKFRYYKNKICAYQCTEKPLFSVNLNEIQSIIKSKINKEETQFELILLQPLTQYLVKNSKLETANLLQTQYKSYKSRHSNLTKSNPEREVIPGHLMRQPLPSRNVNKEPFQTYNQSNSNYQLKNTLLYSNTHQTINSQQFQQLTYDKIANQEESFMQLLQQSYLLPQDQQIHNNQTDLNKNNQNWTKREQEWFNIEERLIFKNNKGNQVSSGDCAVVDKIIKKINQRKAKLIIQQQSLNQQKFQSVYINDQNEENNEFMMTFSKDKLQQTQ